MIFKKVQRGISLSLIFFYLKPPGSQNRTGNRVQVCFSEERTETHLDLISLIKQLNQTTQSKQKTGIILLTDFAN